MKIEFDPTKREATFADRGLDFLDAPQVFQGPFITHGDVRWDYPEPRMQTYGLLNGRLIQVVWTEIPNGIRVISMRKCNERERGRFNP
ncbi:MAG: BrnT family toxin [Novosphingobium sp.]